MDLVPYDPERDAQIGALIQDASEKYDVPEDRLRAVISAESAFNPNAVSRAGAQGLMQLMPATARELGVTDAFDPAQNIDAGARYLSALHDRFGDWDLAHAAYNAGPSRVASGANLPNETKSYVARINSTLQPQEGVLEPYSPQAQSAAPEMKLEPYSAKTDQDTQDRVEALTAEDPFTSMTGPSTDIVGSGKPRTIDETLSILADMPLKDRAAVIASTLPVGAVETAIQMAAQVPQMAAQAVGFAKALSAGKMTREDFDAATQAVTPKWVSDLANAEGLQPQTPAGQVLSSALGEGFGAVGRSLAAPGAGLKAATEAAFAGEGTEGARQRFEKSYGETAPITEQVLNVALLKEMGQQAVRATVDAARAARAPAEVLQAQNVDAAINAAEQATAAPEVPEAPAEATPAAAPTFTDQNAAARADLLRPVEAPLEPYTEPTHAQLPIEDATRVEPQPEPELGARAQPEEPAAAGALGGAGAENHGPDRLGQGQVEEAANASEVRGDQGPIGEGSAGEQPGVQPGAERGGGDFQQDQETGRAAPVEQAGGTGGPGEEAAPVEPQFIDYTAPKAVPDRGILKGEVRTFETEPTAAAYAKAQGLRGYTPRETEDGWVLSKPPPSAAQAANYAALAARAKIVQPTDSLDTLLRKSGGINADALIRDGADPEDISAALRFGAARKSGGMSVDGAAEVMDQHGYNVRDETGAIDATMARDLIQQVLDGEKVYTPQGMELRQAMIEKNREAGFQTTKQDIIATGVEPHDTLYGGLVARAAEIDEGAVERLAIQYEHDGDGFTRALQEFVNAHDSENADHAPAAARENPSQAQARARAPATAADQAAALARVKAATEAVRAARPDEVAALMPEADAARKAAEAAGLSPAQIVRAMESDRRPIGPERLAAILEPKPETPPEGGVSASGDGEAMLRRGAAGGMMEADVRAALKPAIEKTRVPIRVLQSVEDLRKIPGFESAPDDAKGGYRAGRIYAVADNLSSALDAERTIARHEVTHAGIDAIYGGARQREAALTSLVARNANLNDLARQWRQQYGAEFLADRDAAGVSKADAMREMRLTAMEEALAKFSESGNELRGWKAFVAVVQRGLRELGLHRVADWLEGATNAEALKFLGDMRRATEAPPAIRPTGETLAPAFHRAEPTVIPVAKLSGAEIDSSPGASIASKALDWARKNLQGREFENTDTGWQISVGRRGINKTLSHGAREVHARSIAALPELLRNAVLARTEENRNAAQRADVPFVHHFYAPLEIGKDSYVAKLVVMETRDGQRFYDHDLSEEVRPGGPAADAQLPKEAAAVGSGRTWSMERLLQGVKPEDRDAVRARLSSAPRFSRAGAAQATTEDTPSRGELFGKARDALRGLLEEAQQKIAPMATGSDRARAVAKDYANAERNAQYQWALYDEKLRKSFTPDQLKRMWQAADEENVLRQTGQDTAGRGLDRLSPEERAEVERMHRYANALLAQAKEAGMYKGEGLPYWTPRMVANIGRDGEFLSEPFEGGAAGSPYTSPTGRNITTTAASLKGRKHLTTEETEAAAKAKFGADAQVVQDIRTMPLAMARLERAIAGRQLINSIKEAGQRVGEETVSTGEKPGFFTVDHPAFKTYRPKFEEVDGKTVAVKDSQGNVVFEKSPVYVSKEFEGPLKAIMTDKPGKWYSGLMSLKAKATGLIMYSPLIHNAVEWGRAMPLMPGKVFTFRIYFEGNAIRRDAEAMREFIDAGMVPIGKRFQYQDLSGIIEEPTMKPGRSLTAKAVGGAVGAVNKAAGEAVKRGIDTAGDFWHNTLLWDRVGDLQAGIAANMRDYAMAKGLDRESATRVAAHLANRFAGALPNEAMSAMARKFANLSLFSRTFTLGNMGVMKDLVTGLPKDVQAQIRRDAGVIAANTATSLARRKAIHAFVLDIALMYAGNAALQSALDYWKRDKSLDQISRGYVERAWKLFGKFRENPANLLNIFGNIESLSPTSENEPDKENRVLFGHATDGTAVYIRLPTGKIGEEFEGWLTSPLDMLKRKEGTLARPTIQAFTNDRGFGRPVYDANAKGLGGAMKAAGNIVWNYLSQQVPSDSIRAAYDLMKGRGDDYVNALKVLGPLVGVTFSKGAPGGPAVGELFKAEKEHRAAVQRIIPDVRELVQDGKRGEALQLMRENQMTPAEMRITLRYIDNPGARLNAHRLQRFNEIASPEDVERMRELRQSSP